MTARKKVRQQSEKLLKNLEQISTPLSYGEAEDQEIVGLTEVAGQAIRTATDTSRTPRLKRFRFQLLHRWLVENFEPCKVADIGGGKGLLSYLLNQSGWLATVIDPYEQPLPEKYKDIGTDARVKIPAGSQVPYLRAEFQPVMAQSFDLLIGMHAHGCNVKIIDAAAQYGCGFVLLPCCVIDEPFYPPLGVHWLESLAAYAVQKGQSISPIRLNFKGQNIGLVKTGPCQPKWLEPRGNLR